MKKITLCLMSIILSLTFYPSQSTAAEQLARRSLAGSSAESAEAQSLVLRLDEINSMDKSDLKSSEKKGLRKEVQAIKDRLNHVGGGVYISVGGAILILILLIILL